MALFKIFKGNDINKLNNPDNPNYRIPIDGYAYYNTDNQEFYIDTYYRPTNSQIENNDSRIITDENDINYGLLLDRRPINAHYAYSAGYDGANSPQKIHETYIKGISISNNQLSYTTGDGVSHSVNGTIGAVTKISTGAGLIGGDITSQGTIKVNLTDETKLTNAAVDGTETSGRVYPIRLDTNGKLAVNVPWENTTYENNITGTGTNGALAKFSGTNTITDGPAFNSNNTAKFLREDGEWSNTLTGNFQANGDIYSGTLDGTQNRQINVQSGAGRISLISQGSSTGARGLYLSAHGSGNGQYALYVDTNNKTTYYGHQWYNHTMLEKGTDPTTTQWYGSMWNFGTSTSESNSNKLSGYETSTDANGRTTFFLRAYQYINPSSITGTAINNSFGLFVEKDGTKGYSISDPDKFRDALNLGNLATLSYDTMTGTGNAVTSITATNGTLTVTKGETFAPINSPMLTGIPTAPTAAMGTNTTQLATTEFVMHSFVANDAMVFKGVLGTGTGMISSLPPNNIDSEYKQGWTYKVGEDGTYAGVSCKVGDTIYCVEDGTTANNDKWVVLQSNDGGYVIGPANSTTDNIATFTGITGKVIQDSGKKITITAPNNNSDDTTIPTSKVVWDTIDNYVKKSGDTMTGSLTIKSTNIAAASTNVTDTIFGRDAYFRGVANNGELMSYIQWGRMGSSHETYPNYNFTTYSSRNWNSSNAAQDNKITLYVGPDGEQGVTVTSPAAWRAALGLGNLSTLSSTSGSTTKFLRQDGSWSDNLADSSNNITSLGAGKIELFHSTPYIDFHYNKSANDYTSRLIEKSNGTLTCENNFQVNGTLQLTNPFNIDLTSETITGGQNKNIFTINYKNANKTQTHTVSPIGIIGNNNTDNNYNSGIRLGSTNGPTIVGAGESSSSIASQIGSSSFDSENLYLTADGTTFFYNSLANDSTNQENQKICSVANSGLTIYSSNLDDDTFPSSWTTGGRKIFLTDKNGYANGQLEINEDSNKACFRMVAATRKADKSEYQTNILMLGVAKDGTRTVGVSDAAPWRTALGLGNLSTINGPLPVNKGGTGATTLTSGAALIGNGTGAVTTRTILDNTSRGNIGYETTANRTALVTMNSIAFWNGAYNAANASNLEYCNQGKFGTMATKNAADYLPLTGGTMTGTLKISAQNLVSASTNVSGTSSVYSASILDFCAKDNTRMGYIQWGRTAPNDSVRPNANFIRIDARNVNSSNQAQDNFLYLCTEPDGTNSIIVSSPTAWRTGLGLGNLSTLSYPSNTTTFLRGDGAWSSALKDSSDNMTFLGVGNIELYHSTPFIDFHYNKSTNDYTSRLIEKSSGTLTCENNFQVNGTLVLSKTQDASGTADNKPALIVGGASTAQHIEIDSNEILAKSDGTTPGTLYIQDGAGITTISGSGGFNVPYSVSTFSKELKMQSNATITNYRTTKGSFMNVYSNNQIIGYWRTETIGTTSAAGWTDIVLGTNTADNVANNARGRIYLGTNGGFTEFHGNTASLGGTNRHLVDFSYIRATQVWGAVWNDYAEFRETKDKIQPGRCIREIGDDTLELTTERLQRGCEIVSDTYGFAIGESDKCKTPTAASGRVLAYLYEDREIAKTHIGWPVCSGPNGTVSIMTEEEEEKYPSRIIGTISAIPDYEIWHAGSQDGEETEEIKVNGRIWIRIR